MVHDSNSALGRRRRKGQKFKIILSNKVCSRSARTISDSISKNKLEKAISLNDMNMTKQAKIYELRNMVFLCVEQLSHVCMLYARHGPGTWWVHLRM